MASNPDRRQITRCSGFREPLLKSLVCKTYPQIIRVGEAGMIALLGFAVFAGALGSSVLVIAAMIVPQWRRIVSLAAGHVEPSFSPLAQLTVAERRIEVRRWAARPVPMAISQLRAAA